MATYTIVVDNNIGGVSLWFRDNIAGVFNGMVHLTVGWTPEQREGAWLLLAALCPAFGLKIVEVR